ncbi:MAG: hypothetical protein HY290_18630 [Planctomycetia bacterium]|nr:hypothetical protein [Planctomycetia bacterium]
MHAKFTAGAPAMPAVVAGTFGKGRVVYFAAGLDAAYYSYAYPYQRLALKHAAEWAAASPPPVFVKAPMCVHATVMRQSKRTAAGAERLVVHLFNDLNTTAHHALPADDVPLREETVPIRDIRITFGPQYKFRRVHLEPEGREIEMQFGPDGTTIVVPQLDIHTLVVAEL